MHSLQPKHTKLKPEEVDQLVKKLNVAVSQLPKVKASDSGIPENCSRGEIIKIERKFSDGKALEYYRVVI